MSTLSLQLSTQAIMNEIYALSALHSLQNPTDGSCSLLTRDRQAALRLVVKDAFAFIVLKIIPHLAGCNLNEETGTGSADTSSDADFILSLQLNMPDSFPGNATGSLRHALEHAIAMQSLHLCYLNYNDTLSHRHETLANETIAQVISIITSTHNDIPHILPHY